MSTAAQMAAEAETVKTTTPEGKRMPIPYTTRSWAELMDMELPDPRPMWGGIMMGAIGVVFGQGGLGKSRVALNLARNQVLSQPFAGLPTWKEPLRHLMMGSENSIHRLQSDARRMSEGLSASQIELLGAHIRMATLELPDDPFISVSTPQNVRRWKSTLDGWPPDVLWVDPWGDLLDGEANSDEDARQTLATLRRLLRQANPEAGIVVLAHARTGARNIAQAVGFDAANFGKGSKALYSAARCVWNLAPGDESENPPIVCCHAKSNDSQRELPRALFLDSQTMLYTLDHDFDFDAWMIQVSQRARGGMGGRGAVRLTEDSAFDALGDATGTAAEVRQILRDKGATRDNADDVVKRLETSGRWVRWRPHLKHTAVYIGPPSAIQRKQAEIAKQMQGRIEV